VPASPTLTLQSSCCSMSPITCSAEDIYARPVSGSPAKRCPKNDLDSLWIIQDPQSPYAM
jgi:hypothetical protein